VPTPFDMRRIPAADEAGERTDCRKPLIAGPDRASAIFLDMREEPQNQLGGEITDGQPVHRLAQFAADEGQKKAEGVPVALASVTGQIAFGDNMLT